ADHAGGDHDASAERSGGAVELGARVDEGRPVFFREALGEVGGDSQARSGSADAQDEAVERVAARLEPAVITEDLAVVRAELGRVGDHESDELRLLSSGRVDLADEPRGI